MFEEQLSRLYDSDLVHPFQGKSAHIHETILKDHVLVSAGVTIGANVEVENSALIALGAKIISGVSIGENTIVGAGATVVSDLKSNISVFGTPAKERDSS